VAVEEEIKTKLPLGREFYISLMLLLLLLLQMYVFIIFSGVKPLAQNHLIIANTRLK
jgi:hypothetical protein